ncbi:ABC transporter ATP-binding protein [Clostridium ljungdahlii]|uniref:Aliphatic sulfonates import ATP-binding protein SsuB n=1 Tax=Clostridium ljungdahlii (strain ATCC 55383 / DSM 13528 / PETC) TaxID=748727 RepID=D8GI32_CLOLD|nr:ABC transporter ATP-binding protein [Clostridium ljungdahlii]ADK14894.1 predicted ABC nitrate/sulfonate/bicarbonate family transporter, ATPase component [Clostridium ljungdahlii DSM 13528]OAA87889.1 Aliphatic sulfonates import ATP-binding protein SsuB [Clostridium ljungdahlii DSM 13528]
MEENDRDLIIKNLDKSYTVNYKEIEILKNINIHIGKGEFISIVGHSGCGKSTLLKIIAGLVEHNIGSVTLNGGEISEPGTKVGMVFQDHRLLPWLTIKDNISFGLYDVSNDEKEKLVLDHIELVGLKGFENAYPHQLSGGMAQRAAIARALVHKPEVLLLDEPFGALDALTRIQMQREILKIWEKEKTTMILVTHDIDEAIYLGDRIVIMSSRPGKIKKVLPVEIARPRDRNSHNFSVLRKHVFSEFFVENNVVSDYVI